MKAICMKTKDQLYQRESARPRVVLRRNSQSGSQDLPVQEARSSWGSLSEESQQLLVDMNHTEIFELRENSAKRPCLDCNSFTEIGMIYGSCGRNLKYKRSPTTTQKANNDYTSIPAFAEKSCSSRRRRRSRKQDKKNVAAIRRYSQGGKNKKDTEGDWRSTILAKKKLCFTIHRC